jgi:peptide/nickel transport system substrate-binding protein/microcin C transport system substrate-binding protein
MAVPPAAAAGTRAAAPLQVGVWVHALSAYAPAKYAAGFHHFDYVNPEAPKGGTLSLRNPDRRNSFDKFNPYTTKGVAPVGVLIFMVEPLAIRSMDEPLAMYGVLAQAMRVAPDLSSVSFRLDPRARFNNGTPVEVEDVVHSLATLKSPAASPDTQNDYAALEQAVKVDARTVRVDLKVRSLDAVFAAGAIPVFSRAWGAGKPFDQIVLDPPITSGPYTIGQFELPSRIEFKRNPQYWARDLPSRRGHFNFDLVRYRLYKDEAVAREAFKAGEFDLFREYRASSWVRQHAGPRWDDGRIVKRALDTATGKGLQSIQLNARRELFKDVRVREALQLAWDFDKYNQYGVFRHADSVFNNSEFAATGAPSAAELALLEPWRAELPPRVFGPAFVPPENHRNAHELRHNLRRARDLLAQAGWTIAPDGKLRNAQGTAFMFEFLEPGNPNRLIDFQRNLAKLGIELKERIVDYALFLRRLQAHDFDAVVIVEYDFTLPSASNLAGWYGSRAADEAGSSNYRGISSRAVDALIAAIGAATTLDELRTAAHALDRVVMWNFWCIPQTYANAELLSYWNRFGIPAVPARYFVADSYPDYSTPPWPLWTWWAEDRHPAVPRR